MSELSQTVKNFITEFEYQILPHINRGDITDQKMGCQLVTCYVSSATLQDPQLKELLGITPGNTMGKFMGVSVVGKPDMTAETFYKKESQ